MRNVLITITASLLVAAVARVAPAAGGRKGEPPPARSSLPDPDVHRVATPAGGAQKDSGGVVEVGVASWNIEVFDGAGPGDTSFPTRSIRHLDMITETLRRTGAAVIGLQEVIGDKPLDQLLSALNAPEVQGGAGEADAAVWRGASGKTRPGEIHCALLWNEKVLDLVGRVTEFKDLSWGHREGEGVSSKDLLRFHRIPLAARFRVRASPSHDFTVVVIHLKAMDTGIDGYLDSNDRRRRGELEDLIRLWLLKPAAQGRMKDEDLIVLGDMNEKAPVLVQLLDEYGTAPDVSGRFILEPAGFSDPRALMLFADGLLEFPENYTYRGSIEKGQGWGEYSAEEDAVTDYTNFLDHMLLSRSLAARWDGEYTIDYFESRYPLGDHVHISDHRPVSIRLRFPSGAGQAIERGPSPAP